jgi:polyisoprenyl-teichoic acid--peptidoglycan teichoic acid transferase
MIRRLISVFAVLSLVITACSGEPETVDTTTTTSTTTTTTVPTTTTTIAPFEIKGAGEGLTKLVGSFYDYAAGRTKKKPKAPKPVVSSIEPKTVDTPRRGSATGGNFKEQRVAVVEVGKDVFLAVNGENGWQIVGGEWPSLGLPAYFGDGPRHVAVIGSDARRGQSVTTSRADSIHFVALDGKGGGAVVGLPRDSFLPIPGVGRTKITNSLALGGPETTMGALREHTGLPLEGYVITGFAGFESLLTDVLGGVSLEVPFAINDRWAKATLSAGQQILDGAQALGFARARKTVPGGDLTRSKHQGVILLAAAGVVREMGLAAIPGLMQASEPHLETDLTPEQLLTFSAMAVTAELEEDDNIVAPGSPGSAGGASVVFLHSSVSELWEDLADGTLEGEE